MILRWVAVFFVKALLAFSFFASDDLYAEPLTSEFNRSNDSNTSHAKLNLSHVFDIKKQSLETALLEYSSLVDIDVVVPSKLLEGKTVEPLNGIYSSQYALSYLLRGSGLDFKLGLSGTIILYEITSPEKSSVIEARSLEEEVIVNGLRASVLSSIERKKNAGVVSEHIVAKRLGEFPDANLAEAIQRAPGIAISRTIGGEGQFVSVRGLGPEYNTVLINGRELPSDENTRNFSFDIFSSGLFSSVEVYKSVDASVKEGGIGGVINFSTFSALTREDETTFSLGKIYDGNSERWGEHYSFFANRSFDSGFGLSLGVTKTERQWRADMGQSLGRTSADYDSTTDSVTIHEAGAYQFPFIWSYVYKSGRRERLSAFANLQWQISDEYTTSFDSVYALYKTPEFGVYQNTNFATGIESIGNVVIEDDAIVAFDMSDVPYEFAIDPKNRKVKFYQLGWTNDWAYSDSLTFKSDMALLSVARPEGGQQKFWVAGIPGAEIQYRARNGIPDLSVSLPALPPNEALRSWQDYTNDEIAVHFMEGKGDDVFDQTKHLSLTANYELGENVRWTLGINHSRRNKTKHAYYTEKPCSYCDFLFQFGEVDRVGVLPFPVDDYMQDIEGNFPRFWPVINEAAIPEILEQAEQTILNASSNPCGEDVRSVQVVRDPVRSYDIIENQSSAFAMLQWDDSKLYANVGIRVVKTNVRSSGTKEEPLSLIESSCGNPPLEFGDPATVNYSGWYARLLPSLNVKYNVTNDLIGRFSMAKVMSRPSLSSLGPDISWDFSAEPLAIVNGNVSLEPVESDQAEIAIEYYRAKQHVSASLFFKSLENIVSRKEERHSINGGSYRLSYPDNMNDGNVYGVDFSFQRIFESGFGGQANITYLETEENFSTSLTGISKYTYNLVGFYDRGALELRLAYSYRDDYISKGVGQNGLPQTMQAFKTLDVSGEYAFSEGVTLFFNAQNILEQESFEYSMKKNRPLNYEKLGYRLTVGVRHTF